jgi:hypothetical protein
MMVGLEGAQSMVWVVVSTRRVEWNCGWLQKVHCVRVGIVVGLERCPEYGLVDDC